MYKFLKRKISKFRHWMAYDPPGALSTRGWRLFNKEFKEKAPIRWWFHRGAWKKGFILPIKWKYQKIHDWIRYRTTRRYHVLKTGLPPGYYEIETTMLHVNFTILKDFVEVEQAWHYYIWHNKATFCESYMPFYRFFFPFRRPDIGMQHLNWAATLDDPALPPHERSEQQAIDAREMRTLYDWWVNIRPNRKHPTLPSFSHQGLDEMAMLDEDFDRDADDFKAFKEAMDKEHELEKEWDKEDEEMLIRLVKLRKAMWT